MQYLAPAPPAPAPAQQKAVNRPLLHKLYNPGMPEDPDHLEYTV